MYKPPQELIDAFFNWYGANLHAQHEDIYINTITRSHLTGLSRFDFIDFFYKFAHKGGHLQSGGQRSSGKFKQTIEDNYEQFRQFVLNPFDSNFDEVKWLDESKAFKYFGVGLKTIYLNRVDKKRFPILNNKTANSLALLDVVLPSDTIKKYKVVRESQQQLISWFPQFENFYRADALNQFLIGENEGQSWKEWLINRRDTKPKLNYWIFQGNLKVYDVIGALRDGALKTWEANQHKKEIHAGDRVIIWVTGEGRGCYGLATVTSEVQVIKEDPKEASYRKIPITKAMAEGVTIRVDNNLWNRPVYKEQVDVLPGFSNFPAGRQGTNFSISEAHFKAVHAIVMRNNTIEGEVPQKEDVERAEVTLRNTPNEVVSLELILNYLENSYINSGIKLKDGWREITIQNIIKWFPAPTGGGNE